MGKQASIEIAKRIMSAKIVEHDATTTRKRPRGAKTVIWIGSGTPANKKTGDLKINGTTVTVL